MWGLLLQQQQQQHLQQQQQLQQQQHCSTCTAPHEAQPVQVHAL
jgi:hypothetical protein